jgi:hypothetical protein
MRAECELADPAERAAPRAINRASRSNRELRALLAASNGETPFQIVAENTRLEPADEVS